MVCVACDSACGGLLLLLLLGTRRRRSGGGGGGGDGASPLAVLVLLPLLAALDLRGDTQPGRKEREQRGVQVNGIAAVVVGVVIVVVIVAAAAAAATAATTAAAAAAAAMPRIKARDKSLAVKGHLLLVQQLQHGVSPTLYYYNSA